MDDGFKSTEMEKQRMIPEKKEKALLVYVKETMEIFADKI